MLRRLALVCLLMGAAPCSGRSEIGLGFRLAGGLESREDGGVGYMCYRILVGANGLANIVRQNIVHLGIGGDAKVSYRWWDFRDSYMGGSAVLLLVDMYPELGFVIAGVIRPSLGVDFTSGIDV